MGAFYLSSPYFATHCCLSRPYTPFNSKSISSCLSIPPKDFLCARPLLWRKIQKGLSAGRVQSVAVRLICEREEEINAFNAEEYWSITANLETEKKEKFKAELRSKLDTPKEKIKITNQEQADAITAEIQNEQYSVNKVECK